MKDKTKNMLWIVVGATLQGMSIDVSIPFLKGAFLVTGTLCLIHGWIKESNT